MSTPEPPAPTPSATTDTSRCAFIATALRESYYNGVGTDHVSYVFGWDEDAAHICVWPEGATETTPALTTFGDDEDDAAPEIIRWLDSRPVPPASAPAATAEPEGDRRMLLVWEAWARRESNEGAALLFKRVADRPDYLTADRNRWHGKWKAAHEGAEQIETELRSRLTAQATELAALRARVEELEGGLQSVGVFWMPDEDAGEGCASWCTTLDPHGEAPADSLADALAKTMQASENDGRRAMLEKVRATLAEHWLTEVECHHESKTDTAHCYCTVWCSGAMPNVGAAVNAWVEHVCAALAPHQITGDEHET